MRSVQVCLCLLAPLLAAAAASSNPWDLRTRLQALQWSRGYAKLLKEEGKHAVARTLRSDFHSWAAYHGRHYISAAEANRHYGVWLSNLRQVITANLDLQAGGAWPSSWAELNAFADLTKPQFAQQHPDGFLSKTAHPSAHGPRPPILPLVGLPPVVDWVTAGKVPPVRHQRSSDCWANAAATALEAAWCIRTGQQAAGTVEQARVSVQQLGDCMHAVHNSTASCLGSLSLADAFAYAYQVGSVTEAAYPYQGCQLQVCQSQLVQAVPDRERLRPAQPPGSHAVPAASNVTALLEAVGRSPVVFAIASESEQFKQYAGGVFAPSDCHGDPDHVMTIVGYDTTSAPPTWLVQNSYGASWGVDGRMRIRMDWSGHGVCGMYLNVQAPT